MKSLSFSRDCRLSYVDDQKDIPRFSSITNFWINFYNLSSIFLELM